MIIAIAFFSLSGAICTNLFVSAHLTSVETRNNNMAMMSAQSVAECFKATDGSTEETVQLLSAYPSPSTPDTFVLYYDEDWQPVDSAAGSFAPFYLSFSIDEEASPKVVTIDVCNAENTDNPLIYRLNAKKYVAGKGA